MDPAILSLAASVMSVLMPWATVGAQAFVKSAGSDVYQKVKSVVGTLRARWSGDAEATETLNRFEEKPERYQPVLEDILKEKLSQDVELAEELATLLNEMGPSLEIIQQMEEGRRVTGLEAEEMTEGKARVRQDIQRGEDVTGARIRRIGHPPQ
jgi:hypothetical protein